MITIEENHPSSFTARWTWPGGFVEVSSSDPLEAVATALEDAEELDPRTEPQQGLWPTEE